MLVFGMLILTGVAAWWLALRPTADFDADALDALPRQINGWQAVEIEMDESVSDMLAADHNVQRAYLHPHGFQIFVYVGYYGTARGGTPEHTPDVCYPAQGWSISSADRQRVGGKAGFELQEFTVEKDGEERLVHFWYRTERVSGITTVAGLRLSHFWGRLTRNRGDGALIRVSTPVQDGDRDAARARLFGFDAAVEAALSNVWPQRHSSRGELSGGSAHASKPQVFRANATLAGQAR